MTMLYSRIFHGSIGIQASVSILRLSGKNHDALVHQCIVPDSQL
jgi:hypothetical protein